MKNLKKMASKRLNKQEMKRYPLKYLTEDDTDEFDPQKIAARLYNHTHFYKVLKNSIS